MASPPGNQDDRVEHEAGRAGRVRGPAPYLFHPFELAVCGCKGSGRTHLIEDLIARLAPERRVGYAKRDTHGFAPDLPGKDTRRAAEAGAERTWLESPTAGVLRASSPVSPFLRAALFADCDLVLAEGWLGDPTLPKLLFLDGLEVGPPPQTVAACVTDDPVLVEDGHPPVWLEAPAAPLFHRDDRSGIARWLLDFFQARIAARPLKGLVLAGGHSTRMGRDKALLEVEGQTQIERAARLLAPSCAEVRLSVREDQARERGALGWPLLIDRHVGMGPAGGILSALDLDPDAAWLVLGCDLPIVDSDTLRNLLDQRDPWKEATAYLSTHNGRPEPLCAVWEPRSRRCLLSQLAWGSSCPGRALAGGAVKLLSLPDPQALMNVNQPRDLEQARALLASRAKPVEPGTGRPPA